MSNSIHQNGINGFHLYHYLHKCGKILSRRVELGNSLYILLGGKTMTVKQDNREKLIETILTLSEQLIDKQSFITYLNHLNDSASTKEAPNALSLEEEVQG